MDPGERPTEAERAVETGQALLGLRDRRSGLYHQPRTGAAGLRRVLGPTRLNACSLWPFANAWRAVQAISELPGGTGGAGTPGGDGRAALLDAHVDALAAYAAGGRPDLDGAGPLRLEAGTARPPGRHGDAYYDDDGWVALALFAQHELTGDERCLRLGLRVLEFIVSGWSGEAGWASPGGVRWAEPAWSRSRNTCANGPAAEAAVLAHRGTGDERWLSWARRILDWLDAALRDGRGLYADRIDPDGTVHRELWAYNQGTPIGAHVLLYEQTGDAAHLERAVTTAEAALRWLGAPSAIGGQPPEFLAIYLRNVLLLAPYGDVSANVAQVAARAARAWERERTSSGLFSNDKTEINRTAGMAAIYALLAGVTARP